MRDHGRMPHVVPDGALDGRVAHAIAARGVAGVRTVDSDVEVDD